MKNYFKLQHFKIEIIIITLKKVKTIMKKILFPIFLLLSIQIFATESYIEDTAKVIKSEEYKVKSIISINHTKKVCKTVDGTRGIYGTATSSIKICENILLYKEYKNEIKSKYKTFINYKGTILKKETKIKFEVGDSFPIKLIYIY